MKIRLNTQRFGLEGKAIVEIDTHEIRRIYEKALVSLRGKSKLGPITLTLVDRPKRYRVTHTPEGSGHEKYIQEVKAWSPKAAIAKVRSDLWNKKQIHAYPCHIEAEEI